MTVRQLLAAMVAAVLTIAYLTVAFQDPDLAIALAPLYVLPLLTLNLLGRRQ